MSSKADPVQPTVNFAEMVREGPLRGRQILVLFTLGLLVLFDGMDTQMLGVIAHDMTRELSVPISQFGMVFSAGLLGALVGGVILSPLADGMLGRKTIAVSAMTIAGLTTLATPHAGSFGTLLVVRFIAGIGLGAALPAIFTLVSEFSPSRFSRPITSAMVAFAPLGSLLGGVFGRVVVPDHGWQMLLYVGGTVTLLLAALAFWLLPESVHFLLHVKRSPQRALASARGFLRGIPIGSLEIVEAEPAGKTRQPVLRLFTDGLWKLSALVWIMFILNQGILYFVLGWTPALLQKSGLTTTAGMDAAAMFGLGGAIGTIAQGWLATRFNIYRLMVVEMALYVVAILLMPAVLDDATLAPAMVFLIAAGICAYQAGAIMIVVESYPDAIRTTGFGWAFGVGRMGATVAPILAGSLVAAGWSSGHIFTVAAVPGVLSVLALIGIAIILRRRDGAGGAGEIAAYGTEARARRPLPTAH